MSARRTAHIGARARAGCAALGAALACVTSCGRPGNGLEDAGREATSATDATPDATSPGEASAQDGPVDGTSDAVEVDATGREAGLDAGKDVGTEAGQHDTGGCRGRPFVRSSVVEVGNSPSNPAIGDFNGDGVPDLAVGVDNPPYTLGGGVSIVLGKGDGRFEPPIRYQTGRHEFVVAIGDLDGNGVQDLAVGPHRVDAGAGFIVLVGQGNGGFTRGGAFGLGVAWTLTVADLNSDGHLDL